MSYQRRAMSIGSSTASTTSSSLYSKLGQPDVDDMLHFLNEPLPPVPQSIPSSPSNDSLDMVHQFVYDHIDANLIEQELDHRKRESLIQQLLTTERQYVHSLFLLDSVFLLPLKKDMKKSSFHFLGNKKMVLTEREMKWLFGNVDDIIQEHKAVLATLEERLLIWGPTQIISDVIHSWIPKMHMYYEYVRHYDVAMTTYDRLTKYQPFTKFIQQAQKNPSLKNETLLTLLQMPLQCIPRYDSLISAITDQTPIMHPDYVALHHVKQEMNAFAKKISSRLVDADNVTQVQKVQNLILNAPFGPNARRRLILRKDLHRVVVNGKTLGDSHSCVLFSDMLVFVRPKQEGHATLQYKGHIPLEHAKVRKLTREEAGGDNALELISSLKGVDTLNSTIMATSTNHILFAHTKEDQDIWAHKLQKVISKLDQLEAIATEARRQGRTPAHSLHRVGTSSKLSMTSSSTSESEKQWSQ